MDAAHLHLVLNHFPIIGSLVAIAALVWGLFTKNESVKKFGLGALFAMSLLAIPVFATGEPAEERVEEIAGVSHDTIHEHEEAAEFAIILSHITGLASLAALILGAKKPEKFTLAFYVALALSLVTFAAMARTGYLGGQIRHTEFFSAPATQQMQQDGAPKEKTHEQGEHDDDDEKGK